MCRCTKLFSFLQQMPKKPKLIMFDLDRTLWQFGIDEFVYKPPYTKDKTTAEIYDSQKKLMQPYPEVSAVLKTLVHDGIDLGVASRTTFPKGAATLINLFGWDELIKHREIYPGSKVAHFTNIKSKTGIDFTKMVFFDDEERNIVDTTPLGVTAILVDPKSGVTSNVLQSGLARFLAKNE
ncbi:Magnesium-dependent phosphatase 1 [Halotydeus destructor]|nr:Magnesium-dependent phosphatase 1 [Halotydeus destructor]